MANYYYLTDDRQTVGPISLERLRELSHQGVVRPETYVAKEGDPQWRPYAEAIPLQRQQRTAAIPIPIPPLTTEVSAPPEMPAGNEAAAASPSPAARARPAVFAGSATDLAPERKPFRWFLIPLGCIGIILLPVAVGAGILFFVMGAIRSSEPYNIAVSHVQNDPKAVELLGGPPVQTGWKITGSVSVANDAGTAHISIPVSGKSRSGTVEVVGDKQAGKWSYSRMDLLVQGQTLDLLDASEKEQAH